jgi:hypothetical protein
MQTPREKADVWVVSKEESKEDRADKHLRQKYYPLTYVCILR